jgi:hypothetical protein
MTQAKKRVNTSAQDPNDRVTPTPRPPIEDPPLNPPETQPDSPAEPDTIPDGPDPLDT